MSEVLFDNDVVLKACRYCLIDHIQAFISDIGCSAIILSVTKFVVNKRLARDATSGLRAGASIVNTFPAERWIVTDPDENEILLAASFEAQAQQNNLELDAGESQLLAILISRHIRAMITGDKRAIRAIEELAGEVAGGRVACFEQVIATLANTLGHDMLKGVICSKSTVDQSLTICFGCHSADTDSIAISQGLESYIQSVRSSAARVMLVSNDLSGLIA